MRLSEEAKEDLRNATVAVVLAVRREYLATSQANPLKQWDQIQDRMRAAARSCASAEEWTTQIMRSLQISAPSKDSSAYLAALVTAARTHGAREWLDLVEREIGFLIATARLEADRRKSVRSALAAEIEALGNDTHAAPEVK
jgi:hypothetical protein